MIKEKELCPFIKSQKIECYCSNLTSCNIEYVIEYCGTNYRECDIYKKIAESKNRETIKLLV